MPRWSKNTTSRSCRRPAKNGAQISASGQRAGARPSGQENDRIGLGLRGRALEDQVADLDAAALRVAPVLRHVERAAGDVAESWSRVVVAMEEKLAVVRTGRDRREIRDRGMFLGGRHPWQWPQSAQNEDEQEQTTP